MARRKQNTLPPSPYLFRYHRDGFLRVDGGERVTGQSRGSLRTLNAGELTYLGGVEQEDGDGEKLKNRVGTAAGFVGCLRDFRLGRRPVALHSDHDPTVMVSARTRAKTPHELIASTPQVRRGVVDCEENPCVRMPCGEGGSCAVVRDQGFQCRCKAEFTGE